MGLTPLRQNHQNHPQKLTQSSVPKKHQLHWGKKSSTTHIRPPKRFRSLDISSLPSPKFWLSLPRWAGALRQQGEKGATPKLVVFPPAFIFAVRFTQSRCDAICEKNTEGTALFGELLFFFRHSSFKCKDLYVRLETKNICPIGVRL